MAKALDSVGAPSVLVDVAGATPLHALKRLRSSLSGNSPVELEAWRAKARVAAVMGSCPRSHHSFISGLWHDLRVSVRHHGAGSVV